MIGSGVIEVKPQELFEGGSVVDLGFQLRVGIDVKPLLKEQAFHKQDGRIGFISPSAFTDGIGSGEQVFDSRPIHDGIDLLHFSQWKKRGVSFPVKVKLDCIFLKPIAPPDV